MANDHDHFGRAVESLAQYLSLMDEKAVLQGDIWDELGALNGPYPIPAGSGFSAFWKRLQVKVANRLLWRQHAFNALLMKRVRSVLHDGSANTGKPLVLFIVPYDVVQPRVGGAVRVHALVRALASRYRVRLITVTGPNKDPERIPLQPDLEVISLPISKSLRDVMEAGRAKWGAATWLMTLLEQSDSIPFLKSYLERVRSEVSAVILSGPYLGPLVAQCMPDVPVVYETHDVSTAFVKHLANGSDASTVLQRTTDAERKALEASKFAICVSDEDSRVFSRDYGVAKEKLLIVRNGVDTARSVWIPPGRSHALRAEWWQSRQVVLFMGSTLGANIEAMDFIREKLAPSFHRVQFVIMGVSQKEFTDLAGDKTLPDNLFFTGQVPARIKESVLALSDVAIAPVQSGTGSSLKIPDYLAHGKPVISTDLGVRGHAKLASHITIATLDQFAGKLDEMLKSLAANPTAMDQALREARRDVESAMDWSVVCAPMLERLEQVLRR